MNDLLDQQPPEYHRQLLEHNQKFWQVQFDLDDLLLKVVEDEHHIEAPDTAKKTRKRRIKPERFSTDEGRREVNLITSLYPHVATIGLRYTGSGSKSQAVPDRIEVALNMALDQLNPATDSPALRNVWWMVVLGRAADMMVPGDSYYWDFPEHPEGESEDDWADKYQKWQHSGPIPVAYMDLPPQSTFPPGFGAINDEILSTQVISLHELKKIFGDRDLDGKVHGSTEPWSTYTLGIYANKNWIQYVLMGEGKQGYGVGPVRVGAQPPKDEIIRSVEHKQGRVAIRIHPGAVTGRKEPGYYWRSSIALNSILTADKLMTWAGNAAKFDVLPILKAWLNADLEGQGARKDDAGWEEGDVIPLSPGDETGQGKEDVEALHQPRHGEKTMGLAQLHLDRAARSSGATEALEGIIVPSAAAWSVNYSSEQARRMHSGLTTGIAQMYRDNSESLIRSIATFGEKIPLGRNNDLKSEIYLDPTELNEYEAFIKTEFKPKLPQNRRADFDLAMSMAERAKAAGIPVSWPWIAQELMGIEQPYIMFREAVTWWNLTSPPVLEAMNRHWLEEAEIDLGGEEGLTVQELLSGYLDIPPDLKQLMAGAQNGGGGVNPQTRGAIRAGAPFSARPGGPGPDQKEL